MPAAEAADGAPPGLVQTELSTNCIRSWTAKVDDEAIFHPTLIGPLHSGTKSSFIVQAPTAPSHMPTWIVIYRPYPLAWLLVALRAHVARVLDCLTFFNLSQSLHAIYTNLSSLQSPPGQTAKARLLRLISWTCSTDQSRAPWPATPHPSDIYRHPPLSQTNVGTWCIFS